MIDNVVKEYPNLKVVATTLREVKSATINDWSAICWADGKFYKAADYKGLEILDRVGGGDSFGGGLIYSLLTEKAPQDAINFAVTVLYLLQEEIIDLFRNTKYWNKLKPY